MAAGSLSEKRRRRTRGDGRCAGLLNGGALAACTILCAAGSGSYRPPPEAVLLQSGPAELKGRVFHD